MSIATKRVRTGVLAAGLAASLVAAAAASAATAVKPYVRPVGAAYQIKPLFSVGDRVPQTGNPGGRYQMIGIPDGLGAHPNTDGTSTLFMNHELVNTVQSEPIVDGPLQRGAFVSKFLLDSDGDPISGDRAYDRVYVDNNFVGPAPEVGNSTPAFSRFCSGYLAGPANGFDRYIYFAGEESETGTFLPQGGSGVAFYGNEAHVLEDLPHFAYENVVAQKHPGNRTVLMTLEDGPSTPDSQLYMYVGKKSQRKGAGVLARNGLINGTVYVFRATTPGKDSEVDFQQGTIRGEWVAIPGAGDMTAAELEAASDARGAFGFIRIEDGTFNERNRNEFFFNTTGGGTGNQLGRLYSLSVHPGNPIQTAKLTIAYNADHVIASGGDIAVSPDNMDTSRDYLMIQEDGTTQSRAVMAQKGRDGSVWRFEVRDGPTGSLGVDVSSARRVAELNPPGRDGVAVGPGVWESSGIIDASSMFGPNAWLYDVQAHPPTTPPRPNTVEDGQLVLMRPSSR